MKDIAFSLLFQRYANRPYIISTEPMFTIFERKVKYNLSSFIAVILSGYLIVKKRNRRRALGGMQFGNGQDRMGVVCTFINLKSARINIVEGSDQRRDKIGRASW